ncbi:MAG: hypothetical protein OEZ68_16995 [Gammaproteobacteria bacterium]|nr:hypothetical protein [Gammaproteobacteria bacterium]MDH5802500.1 hypothetical protein [Gammaproteobacteria bacterium]
MKLDLLFVLSVVVMVGVVLTLNLDTKSHPKEVAAYQHLQSHMQAQASDVRPVALRLGAVR